MVIYEGDLVTVLFASAPEKHLRSKKKNDTTVCTRVMYVYVEACSDFNIVFRQALHLIWLKPKTIKKRIDTTYPHEG